MTDKKARLNLVKRIQDTMPLSELEKLARDKARPFLAEFQEFCDALPHDSELPGKAAAWWHEKGLVIDFYIDGPALLSTKARRTEDVS